MKKIAVLYGGISSEREVSLISGKAACLALKNAGYEAFLIDVTEDLGALIAALTPKPDAVFNALHGSYGEDGVIQGILDWLNIPYTHSGRVASVLAMDKILSKEIFTKVSVPTAAYCTITEEMLRKADPLPLPYVIKPISDGSSVGVHIIREKDERLSAAVLKDFTLHPTMMAETYIPGRELTVGVLGDKALTVTDIVPVTGEFYDYRAKYAEGGSVHIVPADIKEEIFEQAMAFALAAHQALGCRGVSRADFRYDEPNDRLILLEVNTQPGLTPTSLVPEQALACGLDFEGLCSFLVEEAKCRG